MYLSNDLLIFAVLNRKAFFDVLQVFVLFHLIGTNKIAFGSKTTIRRRFRLILEVKMTILIIPLNIFALKIN
jgi:hypothetical protein